jgi:hypothetical protein
MLHPATLAIQNTIFFFLNVLAIAELEHAVREMDTTDDNATLSPPLAGKYNDKTAA